MADIVVLRITITADGLAQLAKERVLEILQFPEHGLRIYTPLHRVCRSSSGNLLYTVDLPEHDAGTAMSDN